LHFDFADGTLSFQRLGTTNSRMASHFHAARVRRVGLVTACVSAVALTGAIADARFTRAEADRLQQKIAAIVQHNPSHAPGGRARLTPVTENEVNAYLRFHLREQVPQGIAEPTIDIIGEGRVSGAAIVDLDAVSRSRASGSWFDPVRLLSGRLPVVLTGVLHTTQGTGRFTVESATISGMPVPKAVLQQVVTYYSRTTDDPDGINLDDAFELPAEIQEIRVRTGEAIVVQ
jgi:hypothetical protein